MVTGGLALFVYLAFSGCDTERTSETPPLREGRGAIQEVTMLYQRELTEISDQLDEAGLPLAARYGVTAHKLVYETIDWDGNPVAASGALLVPSPVLGPLDIVSVQHGTMLLRDEAPSQSEGTQFLGLMYAMDGYLAVLPDLLGLGESAGLHPYHHAASAGTAVVDMLRAAHDFAMTEGVALTGDLFLTGYSQGGHTAMAAHRMLETEYADEFTVTASAPMAGAYDISGTMLDLVLSGAPYPTPYYLPYLLLAYNEVYNIFDSPSDFLASPYDVTIPPLFDGRHSGGQVNALLPGTLREIINPTLLAEFEHDPDHFLRDVLADNDVYRWSPRAPIRLYHCSGDAHVPIANAHVALEGLKGGTGTVELVEPADGADHGGCARVAIFAGKVWFDTL